MRAVFCAEIQGDDECSDGTDAAATSACGKVQELDAEAEHAFGDERCVFSRLEERRVRCGVAEPGCAGGRATGGFSTELRGQLGVELELDGASVSRV